MTDEAAQILEIRIDQLTEAIDRLTDTLQDQLNSPK